MPDNPGAAYAPLSTHAPGEVRPYLPPYAHSLGPRTRPGDISRSIDEALKALPRGKRGAVMAHTDGHGARLAVFGRRPGRFFGLLPPGEWSYVGTVGYGKGKLTGNAAVAYSW